MRIIYLLTNIVYMNLNRLVRDLAGKVDYRIKIEESENLKKNSIRYVIWNCNNLLELNWKSKGFKEFGDFYDLYQNFIYLTLISDWYWVKFSEIVSYDIIEKLKTTDNESDDGLIKIFTGDIRYAYIERIRVDGFWTDTKIHFLKKITDTHLKWKTKLEIINIREILTQLFWVEILSIFEDIKKSNTWKNIIGLIALDEIETDKIERIREIFAEYAEKYNLWETFVTEQLDRLEIFLNGFGSKAFDNFIRQ